MSLKSNKGIEVLRAIAVLLVFNVHFFSTLSSEVYGINLNKFNFEKIYKLGENLELIYLLFRQHFGVELFFLISGFLITNHIYKREKINIFIYLYNRLLRIFPAFVVALFISFLVRVYLVETRSLDLWRLFQNLILIDYWYLRPSWTLAYELVFYFTVPFIIYAVKKTKSPFLYFILIFLCIFSFTPYPRFSVFFIGSALSIAISSQQINASISKIIVLLFLLVGWFFYAKWPTFKVVQPVLVISLIPLFVYLLSLDVSSKNILVRLGKISYSFYLYHSTCLWFVLFWFQRFEINLKVYWHIWYLTSILLGILVAKLSFDILERMYFNFHRKY